MNSIILKSRLNGKIKYELTMTYFLDDDNIRHKVYGISIRDSELFEHIEDISDHLKEVEKLFDLMAEEQLYPEHLLDVAEDYVNCEKS